VNLRGAGRRNSAPAPAPFALAPRRSWLIPALWLSLALAPISALGCSRRLVMVLNVKHGPEQVTSGQGDGLPASVSVRWSSGVASSIDGQVSGA